MPFPTAPRLSGIWPEYKSPHGPKYHFQTHFGGITTKTFVNGGVRAGMFGGVALVAVIFFASGMPRIQQDILMKFPYLDKYYKRDKPASDNPF
ncbi:ubiquinol-cytochrome-c reductase complex subunit-domain-containing protein [Staphylotrichum tortipilum]|uniref:Ubiquinol-cytochrome-c reductase complex subunit-domain-containing protein n=1 Tax=Staphylotrichum tortipilum TaxID=2831512 RepID=A0AAN6MNS3_9PEZI|nr:ubiquinol-cytochrome-c reductase complex subunit-domain-containing protein [Staphylotrichum longicolle]